MRMLMGFGYLCFIISGVAGCGKKAPIDPAQLNQSCSSPPAPVGFVFLDKQGRNLAAISTISIVLSQMENGQPYAIPSGKISLRNASTDTTARYGGIGIGCDIGSYSVRQTSPVKTFAVTINHTTAGTIYYDLQRMTSSAKNCYRLNKFTFNGQPVAIDSTVIPWIAVLKVNN